MKKQINPNIKAHLIRGAFYLLLLVAVCAIPFALAQRNGTRRTNIRGVPHLPQRSLTTGFTNAYGTVPLVFKKSLIAPFLLNRPIGCPAVITQSTSNVIEQGDSVSCNNGLESTENHYWRAFNMNDFTGGLAYTTTSLDMGIEQATSGGITLNSITVNIYSNHGSPFPGGDWQSNLVGTSGPIDIPDQSLTYPVNIPVTATVEAGALELVLEVVGADGQGLGNLMFIGANSSAETGLSYVSAADCGITDPTPTGDVGFPDTHWVFFVNGGCGGASPTPTATATASGSPTCTPGGTPGPWTIVAPYPLIIESPSVCSDGTFGYAAGGRDASNFLPTNAFNRYDPVLDTWTPLANLLNAIYDARSVYAANTNSIYVFGGIDINGFVTTLVQIYDVGAGTWSTGASMPAERFFPATAYYGPNGKIYVAGGIDGSFLETSTTWEYDPVANTWNTSRAPIPVVMGGSAVSLVGQNMYLQGSFGSGATNFNYSYDIVADAWTQKANMPAAVYEAAGAAIGTNTYVVGGGDPASAPGSATGKAPKAPHSSIARPDTSFNTTYIYDTVADSWTTGPNTNVAHSFTGGTAIGNSLIVVGGFDGSEDTNVAESSLVAGPCASPSPTATATATVTASATPTATTTATPTASGTATATATPTSTARPTPTPRAKPTPRPAPTPGPRPTIKPSPWPPPSPTP